MMLEEEEERRRRIAAACAWWREGPGRGRRKRGCGGGRRRTEEAEDGRVLWCDRYIFSIYHVLVLPYGCRLHLDCISGGTVSRVLCGSSNASKH